MLWLQCIARSIHAEHLLLLKRLELHTLRHSFVSAALISGVAEAVVRE
jgi:hypothetical protein